jgi:type II secretory pathway pseudopilin PulG
MKQEARQNESAFTIIELLVVVTLLTVLAAALLLPLVKRTSAAQRVSCINNLREIANAYRIWAGDHGDRNPAETITANGGWRDLLTNADQGALCWTNYLIISNELGQYPKTLVCPHDERQAARNFDTDFRDNTHISYFVGVSANDYYPQSIQGGDRNLGNGPEAYRDYGFSPGSGRGNDVAIETNALFKPVSWSAKMHTAGASQGAGNILLADGSAQISSSTSFRRDWLSHADPTTNWPAGHAPAAPSIRLVFP